MTELMNKDIWNGKSLADLITLEFLTSMIGSVLSAIAILVVGMLVGRWARGRIVPAWADQSAP